MSEVAIHLENLGKMYKLYVRQRDKMTDALGINRLLFWRQNLYREFWALRELDLKVKSGERLGIIGRNGAGKSTLLKIICGNTLPTEGECQVHGRVQALLELGTGFHPEFTGRQNIHASLAFHALTPSQIKEKEADIIEFAELGTFIDQPIKTYSAGMQARLAFSTATAIEPDLLIIDEVLSVGDAYFASKCLERMYRITEQSGATVLFVSHDLGSVLRLCERVFWLERGRIVMNGPSLEVVKAYEKFIRTIEDRRLKAKNRKRLAGTYDQLHIDGYADALFLKFQLQGNIGATCDITEVALLKDGRVEELLKVGDVQDTSGFHAAAVVLHGYNWSPSQRSEGLGFYRSLSIRKIQPTAALGQVIFYSYFLETEAAYSFRVRYRCPNSAQVKLMIHKNHELLQDQPLPQTDSEWSLWETPSLRFGDELSTDSIVDTDSSLSEEAEEHALYMRREDAVAKTKSSRSISSWPGEGSLTIEDVVLLDWNGQEQTVFQVGSSVSLRMTMLAHRSGQFKVIPVAVIHRLDGIVVSQHWGSEKELDLDKEEQCRAQIDFKSINLGNGDYVFSVGLFRQLDLYDFGKAHSYHIIDRSYEFKVVGNPPRMTAVFQHPAEWSFL